MKFGIIDPRSARAEIIDAPDWYTAGKEVGIVAGQTDHGLIVRDKSGGLGYFVYEFGMFVPDQRYCSIGRILIAGSAVLYEFDGEGESMDLGEMPPVVFYGNDEQVENAIAAGHVERPQVKINDVVFWTWPDPPDADIAKRMATQAVDALTGAKK